MYIQTALLFDILVLLMLGAVIAFAYTVVRPVQVRLAVRKGRQIAAAGTVGSRREFDFTYRMLATAHNDLEAADLWLKLKEIRERAGNQPD